ncbi:MAG TPA: dihydrolipoamide acetyltransferase family protein [Candidatus Acidoferrales bacterium]|nr:dihydrolipoamide acetyltransferase family protein [Candidatus Acidoferrales bacterium]
MAVSVVMPALEMAQETGKVVSWRKREGQQVAKGEPLLEVETDKAVVEVESPGDGILSAISAHEGAVVPVGQTIAWLLAPGEAAPVATAPAQTGRRSDSAPSAATAATAAASAPGATASSEVRISPKARRLAREHGVDVTRLRGSGPGGEILAEDVMHAAKGSGAAATTSAGSSAAGTADQAAATNVEELGTVGRLMAQRTAQSWTTIPHFFVTRDADASGLLEFHDRVSVEVERARGFKATLTDVLVALVARVLARHPRMNASWTGDGIRRNSDVNLGLAIAVEEGVVAPVVHKANLTTIEGIAVRRRELAERAKAGHLQPADITGGTFTISNLGMYNVDAFTAIIVPPQAGILAVGRVGDRVVAVDGKPAVRPILSLTLSTDHRVADGARAAQFLNDVVDAIREPRKWME